MNTLRRLWNGELSLPVAFWIGGVAVLQAAQRQVAVNARPFEPFAWAFYPIDQVDGADTWTCVGEMAPRPASAGP
jgi:hypothetical protein